MRAPSKLIQIALSNGEILEGRSIGADVRASGELVFTTGMVGYTEALTDPSYYGQILVFTYPLIGNYGVFKRDADVTAIAAGFESARIHVAGVVVSQANDQAFHWNSACSFGQWLRDAGVPGISGVDTRRLAKSIRDSDG